MSAFQQMLTVLQQACAQASNVRLPAEEQLRQWEIHPSYYATLQVPFETHALANCGSETVAVHVADKRHVTGRGI